MLGEVYAYEPSANEILVSVGVWAIGALAFTLMVRVAMAVNAGAMRYDPPQAFPMPDRIPRAS